MRPFTHKDCLGARGIKIFKCVECGCDSQNYMNGIDVCRECCIKANTCEICGKEINILAKSTYKKAKTFKSELRMYVVEIEISEEYLQLDTKLVIKLYNGGKFQKFHEETVYIKNGFSNDDLDKVAIKCIEKYEDWKAIE